MMKPITAIVTGVLLLSGLAAHSQETLPPLNHGKAPSTFDEMWAGFDPRKEPLEVEILKQWEEEGVVLKVLRYRIGVFKGQKAMMAAVYGCPKGAKGLPGLLQIHGGGQFADWHAPLTNAKRGYATISIAWAGRISAPGYNVGPDEVKLFWDGKTGDPKYKITTDWGALDGYHAPCRNPKNEFSRVSAAPWTIDSVESPRNNSWFLCVMGARRALTFLEQQPEVNKNKLGVYGHSMGGKLTVMTAAADQRIKAAAPSCGGLSDRGGDAPLYRATVGDAAQLPHIACPIVFLSPANDFHGRINDLPKAVAEIKSAQWRITCSPHHNHQDTEPYQVAGLLWFDQCLKGSFAFPATPEGSLMLKTATGVPRFTVRPDMAKKPLSVDVFYTQQGKEEAKDDRENTIARFWHHAPALRNGNLWTADLPVLDAERPLWAYANVLYPLEQPVEGAGYYYGVYKASSFNVSSVVRIASPGELKAAGVKATATASTIIEAFEPGWEKEWFTYDLSGNWARRTHKLYDPQYRAPAKARLSLEVRAREANKMTIGLDGFAAEIAVRGGPEWQSVTLASNEFQDGAGAKLVGWEGIKELRLGAKEILQPKQPSKAEKNKSAMPVIMGGAWNGTPPEFRNLRWTDK